MDGEEEGEWNIWVGAVVAFLEGRGGDWMGALIEIGRASKWESDDLNRLYCHLGIA